MAVADAARTGAPGIQLALSQLHGAIHKQLVEVDLP
jgi:hypothetical protein